MFQFSGAKRFGTEEGKPPGEWIPPPYNLGPFYTITNTQAYRNLSR